MFTKRELAKMRHDAIRTRNLIEASQDQLWRIEDFIKQSKKRKEVK